MSNISSFQGFYNESNRKISFTCLIDNKLFYKQKPDSEWIEVSKPQTQPEMAVRLGELSPVLWNDCGDDSGGAISRTVNDRLFVWWPNSAEDIWTRNGIPGSGRDSLVRSIQTARSGEATEQD